MEGIKRKIKSFILGWYTLLALETPDWAKDRMKICKTCKHNKLWICKKCGCVLHAKTRSYDEECPEGLWDRV